MTESEAAQIARKMFAFAGDRRAVEIEVSRSIEHIADALLDAYRRGYEDGRSFVEAVAKSRDELVKEFPDK